MFLSFSRLRNQLLRFDRHFLRRFNGLVNGLGSWLLELEDRLGFLPFEDVLLTLLFHLLLGLARGAELGKSFLDSNVQIFLCDAFFRIFEFLKDVV